MNYKNFPAQYWTEIQQTIAEFQKRGTSLIAAFDADGTLWDTDLGENFFQYQIDNQQISLPPDPWNHYYEMKKINENPRNAYAWLAQINCGVKLTELQKWAQMAFDQIAPSPIFSEQKKLIDLLLKHQVQVYIVTASIKWAIEPAARRLGLSPEHVIGVETRVVDGIITEEVIHPITYRQGKVEALLNKIGPARPFLCAGNTIGDYELLLSSTNIRLAVSAASRDDKLFKSESELLAKAGANNWWQHRFI